MRRMRPLLLVITLVTFSSLAGAQVLETSKGKVEFIGLRDWTPEMIQTRLGYDSPDKIHYCAGDLKSKLGFAEAAVILYVDDTNNEKGNWYTVITVVEPGGVAQVQYRPAPTKSIATPAEWNSLLEVVKRSRSLDELSYYAGTFKNALQPAGLLAPKQSPAWWSTLQQLSSKRDYETALKVLSQDADPKKRQIAAIVLTNFADRDAAWAALVEGLRDGNNAVVSTCGRALFTITSYVPRTVDWSQAKVSIRHLLNGTNLFALPIVLNTLLKTNISHGLAKPLLRDGGGRMLLGYLRARHEKERTLSRELLARLSGKNFGPDDARWAAWMASIK